MAIATLDQYIAAAKQTLTWVKTPGRVTVAAMPYSAFDLAGNPGAGALAIGNTANGIVQNSSTTGFPTINAFGGGAAGYLSKVNFASTVACRILLVDRLFSCGAYTFNAAVTLAGQPSFASRVPNTDYKGLQIYVEQVTNATGNQTVTVTYTDDTGATGHTTGAVGIGAAPLIGRMWQLPLQAGDKGVSIIESVTGLVASAGTFNVHIVRPLWTGRIPAIAAGDVHDLLKTGLPVVYAASALWPIIIPDSTALGVPEMLIEVANA